MSSTRLSGIDVSKWQGEVNWQAVKQAGVAFAFVRASYGSSEVDSRFAANWQGMKNVGLPRGAYHFFVTADDATAQANLFLRGVGSLEDGDLPPVLDVEAQSGTGAHLVGSVQTWLDLVERELGRRPIIYTGPSFWNQNLTGGFGSYPLWVAEYGVSSPKPVNGWDGWTFWQYSESGAVEGVAGNTDLDYFNGSPAELAALTNPTAGSSADTPAAAATGSPTVTSPPPPAAQTYTVQPGDTLSAIAERHGTTADAISRANGIENPNAISVGQVLTIP
jgi:lysozyme